MKRVMIAALCAVMITGCAKTRPSEAPVCVACTASTLHQTATNALAEQRTQAIDQVVRWALRGANQEAAHGRYEYLVYGVLINDEIVRANVIKELRSCGFIVSNYGDQLRLEW